MSFSLLIALHYLAICSICQKSSIPLVVIIDRFHALSFICAACCCLQIFLSQKKRGGNKNGWKSQQSVTQWRLAHMTKWCHVGYLRTIFFFLLLYGQHFETIYHRRKTAFSSYPVTEKISKLKTIVCFVYLLFLLHLFPWNLHNMYIPQVFCHFWMSITHLIFQLCWVFSGHQ